MTIDKKMGTSCEASPEMDEKILQQQMSLAELDILKLTGIPMDQVERKYVTFPYELDEMIQIRTFIFSEDKHFTLPEDIQ